MKEHTRNVIVLLCVVVIAQPWLIQNAYTAVEPEAYDNYDTAIEVYTIWRWWNTTDTQKTAEATETFTANDTFTIAGVGTVVKQEESDPCSIEFYFKDASTESTKFNDSAFELPAAERITSILVKIFTDDDAVSSVLNIGFTTGTTADKTILGDSIPYTVGTSAASAVSLRVYIPLTVYNTIESEARFDTAPLRLFVDCDAGADLSQKFTVQITFETGADYASWETYLLGLGLLNFVIAIGMTKAYDMTPGRTTYSKKRKYRRRK